MNAGGELGASASPLGDRYNIVRELGRGGFGQTYLAEDIHRFKELCVIKEFVPQVADKATLNKAKELFEREANVLYQLSHQQIPEFRQLLEVESDSGGRLFLVQDYVEGHTYDFLLQERQRSGGKFSETEVTQLLYGLLPVLAYIHSFGLVHRDISPDNIILRRTDGLPVLIDFGSVKEIAAAVRSQLAIEGIGPVSTRIGKAGYVPPEQLSSGEANPTSDLYGLAATLMVLANGQTPQVLSDPYYGTWNGYDALSPKLGQILSKMLAASPEERFPNAESVLAALKSTEALSGIDPAGVANQPQGLYPPVDGDGLGDSSMVTAMPQPMVSPGMAGFVPEGPMSEAERELEEASDVYEPEPYVETPPRKSGSQQALFGLLALLGLVGLLLLLALNRLTNSASSSSQVSRLGGTSETVAAGEYSAEETARRQRVNIRREELGINSDYFNRLIDQLFYQEYPTLRNSGPDGGRKPLTAAAADEPLRLRWDNIALDTLNKLEDSLSDRARAALGSYSEANRDGQLAKIQPVNVGERSLDDLTEAKFFSLFPSQSGLDFLTQPTGQIYYALADDRAEAIASGNSRQDVQFSQGAFSQDVSAQLAPGEGKVYTMRLSAGQQLRLNLSAPAESTLLSLHLPNSNNGENPSVLADSEQTTWSGGINQSGYYQAVVVNRSPTPINSQLAISVDSVTSAPVAPPADSTGEPNSETDTNQSPSESAETDSSAEGSSTGEVSIPADNLGN
jgi:serine/threonine protein kinase, bacterial